MKKTLLLFTFVFGGVYSAWAGACASSTLAVYDTAGFSCSIGDITFDSFSYVPSGSEIIPAADVAVTPEIIGGELGFQFNAPWFALPGGFLDSYIDYTATCNGCEIDDLVLTIGGATAGTGGIVNVAETSPALTGSLVVGAAGSTTILSDSQTFTPVGSLTVSKDILLAGGSGGLGSQVSAVTNLFSSTSTSTVPEPPLLYLSVGLLGLVPFARRKFAR